MYKMPFIYSKRPFKILKKQMTLTYINDSLPEANDSFEMFPFILQPGDLLFNVTGPDLTADLDELMTLSYKVILHLFFVSHLIFEIL